MVEGQRQEEVLEGVHPVLLARAGFQADGCDDRAGVRDRGMKWFLLTVLGGGMG